MEKFVVARIFIQSSFVQEFHRQMEELTMLSRKEPGCLEYRWYAESSEEGAFTVIERYRDQEDLKYHFSRPYLQDFVDKVNAWRSQELQVHFLSAASGAPES
jgi:quinol monooxygenase YgiN